MTDNVEQPDMNFTHGQVVVNAEYGRRNLGFIAPAGDTGRWGFHYISGTIPKLSCSGSSWSHSGEHFVEPSTADEVLRARYWELTRDRAPLADEITRIDALLAAIELVVAS